MGYKPCKHLKDTNTDKYTDAFKRHAVARACDPTTTRTAVAKQLNVPRTTLAKWCTHYLALPDFFAPVTPNEEPEQPQPPPYAKAEHPNGVTLTRTDSVFVVTIRRDTETTTAVFDTNLELKTQFTLAN